MEKLHLIWLVPIFYEKNILGFFISNQVTKGLKIKSLYIKNGLKVKQLAKQPPTLKMLMQKILVGLWVKKFTFSILSSLKLNFSTTFFGTT